MVDKDSLTLLCVIGNGLTVCVIVPEGDLPEWDTGAGVGVDGALAPQEKLEARKLLDAKRAAESPASSVSMKAQSDGVAVGHVFGYAKNVQRTGTRTRERCVRDQSKRAWEILGRTWISPLQCLTDPFGSA